MPGAGNEVRRVIADKGSQSRLQLHDFFDESISALMRHGKFSKFLGPISVCVRTCHAELLNPTLCIPYAPSVNSASSARAVAKAGSP